MQFIKMFHVLSKLQISQGFKILRRAENMEYQNGHSSTFQLCILVNNTKNLIELYRPSEFFSSKIHLLKNVFLFPTDRKNETFSNFENLKHSKGNYSKILILLCGLSTYKFMNDRICQKM